VKKVQQKLLKQEQKKKARKAFSKLGLKVFPGVRKVTIKQTQILFVIQKPEVFKLGNSYVIFGKVSYKELTGKKGAMDDLKENLNTQQSGAEEEIPVLEDVEPKIEEIDMGDKKDVLVEEKDIELVKKSVPNAPREEMIRAIQENDGDVVNAIMKLKTKYK